MLPLAKSGDSIEVILKLPGEACNLNCAYCYEKRQPSESDGIISPQILLGFIKKYSNYNLCFSLHGGEPLLIGMENLKKILQVIEKYSPGAEVKIQTNGLLLKKSIIDLFSTFNLDIVIGVSYDGPEKMSSYRFNYNGKTSGSDTESKLRWLSDLKMNIGVISVIHSKNISNPDNLLSNIANYTCIKTLNLVPCFDNNVVSRDLRGKSGDIIKTLNIENTGMPDWSITPLQYCEFLKKVWAWWERNPLFAIEPFVSLIRAASNKPPESCDFTEKKCGHVLTLYPNGNIHSCDEFENSLAEISNLKEDKRWLNENDSLVLESNNVLKKCESCSHKKICKGGCVATRVRYLGTNYYEDYCSYKKEIIDFVTQRM